MTMIGRDIVRHVVYLSTCSCETGTQKVLYLLYVGDRGCANV